MPQLAVCLKELPGTDLRAALEEALDIARRLDCLVEMSIRGGTLILHADTPLENARPGHLRQMPPLSLPRPSRLNGLAFLVLGVGCGCKPGYSDRLHACG